MECIDWSKVFSMVIAILVRIAKGVLLVAVVSVCVVLWLVGIPVSPRR